MLVWRPGFYPHQWSCRNTFLAPPQRAATLQFPYSAILVYPPTQENPLVRRLMTGTCKSSRTLEADICCATATCTEGRLFYRTAVREGGDPAQGRAQRWPVSRAGPASLPGPRRRAGATGSAVAGWGGQADGTADIHYRRGTIQRKEPLTGVSPPGVAVPMDGLSSASDSPLLGQR